MKAKTIISAVFLTTAGIISLSPVASATEINQNSEMKSNGYVQFKQNLPLDPDGNTGALRIEEVSKLDFGVVTIKGDTATYNSIYSSDSKEETKDELGSITNTDYLPMYIRTADDRGTNEGWQLQVIQSRAFTELEADRVTIKPEGSALTGATIKMNSTNVVRPLDKLTETVSTAPLGVKSNIELNGGFQTLVNAEKGNGMGTWNSLLGSKVGAITTLGEDKDKNPIAIPVENDQVQLTIPGDTAKVKDVLYQAELTWILISTPEIVK